MVDMDYITIVKIQRLHYVAATALKITQEGRKIIEISSMGCVKRKMEKRRGNKNVELVNKQMSI